MQYFSWYRKIVIVTLTRIKSDTQKKCERDSGRQVQKQQDNKPKTDNMTE